MNTTACRDLVVGVGNEDRSDDTVGLLVARALLAAGPDTTDVVELRDVCDVLDVWDGYDTVVVVDAVRTGAEPGVLHVLDLATTDRLPETGSEASTHVVGIDTVVRLARQLGRLPEDLHLVGVETAQFTRGAPPSAAVIDAVPRAVAAIEALLAQRAGVR